MDNKVLLRMLNTEFMLEDRSGIYGYTQRALAFNSNKIEGSTLTEEQTAALFEEGYLPTSGDVYRSKDIEEMSGHFLMFNKMLSTIDEPLSEDLIKQFHYELKAGVFEDRANGYAIGDYKRRGNTVGGLELVAPAEVHTEMMELLEWYAAQTLNLSVLAELHARYERIHPFQDGNGRTGRLLLFRECLRSDVTPFIIRNENRAEYIAALHTAQTEHLYDKLIQVFEKEQENYAEKCKYFGVDSGASSVFA